MRTRRAFRPAFEFMPSRDLPSNVLLPVDPLAPIMITPPPPPSPVDPTAPIHITAPLPYEEPIVGPDQPPAPIGTQPDYMT